MVLPMGNCISYMKFLRQIACHRGWSPLPNLLPSLLPNPQSRVQPDLPRGQVAAKLQPSLQLESPFQ